MNDPVFAIWFYRSLFPVLVQTALVIIPSLVGLHSPRTARAFRKPWRVAFRTLGFIAIAELMWQNSLLCMFWSPHLGGRLEGLPQLNMFALVAYWPLSPRDRYG
jgi:hypothetical protein